MGNFEILFIFEITRQLIQIRLPGEGIDHSTYFLPRTTSLTPLLESTQPCVFSNNHVFSVYCSRQARQRERETEKGREKEIFSLQRENERDGELREREKMRKCKDERG